LEASKTSLERLLNQLSGPIRMVIETILPHLKTKSRGRNHERINRDGIVSLPISRLLRTKAGLPSSPKSLRGQMKKPKVRVFE